MGWKSERGNCLKRGCVRGGDEFVAGGVLQVFPTAMNAFEWVDSEVLSHIKSQTMEVSERVSGWELSKDIMGNTCSVHDVPVSLV